MTIEEHEARAMLMGLIYYPWANVYGDIHLVECIDADTLEPADRDLIIDKLMEELERDEHAFL